jgi:hypothetical protein
MFNRGGGCFGSLGGMLIGILSLGETVVTKLGCSTKRREEVERNKKNRRDHETPKEGKTRKRRTSERGEKRGHAANSTHRSFFSRFRFFGLS